MGLSRFFTSSETLADTHSWTLVRHDATIMPVDALAEALAGKIVQRRCRGCPQHYQAWAQAAAGGPALEGAARKAVRAFIRPVFGLPDSPESVPAHHMQGMVAQYVWYFLALEGLDPEPVVRVEMAAFAATDPGGDGLVIHGTGDEFLMFRLWEIKKFAGESRVSSTVSRAYRQLDAKAIEYLARYTAIGQEVGDQQLADFYGQLIDLWVDAEPEAAAGVCVATSAGSVPSRCFTTFGQRFPGLCDPVRLRGMLTAIGDFADFTLRVRQNVWTGL